MDIYNKILETLDSHNGQLVAVSKTKPQEAILSLYDKGQRIFGENRVQELVEKHQDLPKDIQWHLIGHLQTNKVKFIAPFVSLIHSIDSVKLLKQVNSEAEKCERVIPVLLQFKIAEEATKYGFDMQTAIQFLESDLFSNLKHIVIVGVMGMATFTDDQDQVKKEFQSLKNIFDQLKEKYFKYEPSFKEISMGMSGDYQLALAEGSTMVRIGSLLFGHR